MIDAEHSRGGSTADAVEQTGTTRPMPEWQPIDVRTFQERVARSNRPAVLRGQVAEWPVVRAAAAGDDELLAYLLRFDQGAQVELFVGTPEMNGRFFYDDDLSGFNFSRARGSLEGLLRRLPSAPSGSPLPPVYMGSVPVEHVLPGLEQENPLPLIEGKRTIPRVWIGNRSTIAPHFDETENVACVVAGRRRFTLFPPDQVDNLYVGPLDFTMAGQPASMVHFTAPDLALHPRFEEALRNAVVADLGPGDAIYIPALWWHGVEARSDFNILINYWWKDAAPDAASPFACLAHGILTIAELPRAQREAWRALFDHFVFQRSGDPAAHLPPGRRGILDRQTPQLRDRIRRFLLAVLGGA